MGARLERILAGLEEQYGKPKTRRASDPYEMLVFMTCGYPASEAACTKGFDALKKRVGVAPADVLRASEKRLIEAMRAGGIVPELRAQCLREIAAAVVNEYGGDLKGALAGSLSKARKILKTFPTIADAGAERIMLLSRLAPVMAVPSNAVQVPLRLGFGSEGKTWAASYESAQKALAVQARFSASVRPHVDPDCDERLRPIRASGARASVPSPRGRSPSPRSTRAGW
jgi:hypothetical protein